MAAYDPKRPRPGGGDTEEPAPVEALLEPQSASGLVVEESVSEDVVVDPATGQVVGERVVTDDVVIDEATGEVVAEEIVVEEITVDEETGDVVVATTVIDQVVTEDGVVVVTETVVDEVAIDDESGDLVVTETVEVTVDDDVEVAARSSADVEVDLRDASPNGSGGRAGSEVPVAAAPEEGTANRAVVIAGVSAVGLLALVLAILLRRRRAD